MEVGMVDKKKPIDFSKLSPLEGLKLAQEATESLAGVNGYKALMRKFGDLLALHFGVKCLSLAAFHQRQKKLVLKKRAVRFSTDLTTHTDDYLLALSTELTASLASADFTIAEMRDGFSVVIASGKSSAVAVVDDPEVTSGSLLIWDIPESGDSASGSLEGSFAAGFLDMLVKQLQSQCRWYRRLDKTQAMLYRDDLTGLFNYRYFELALDQELARASRFQASFCLLFIDMDGFKNINDQYGHLAGSSILKQVADVLRDAVREIDVPIRYGGDEFVVVLLGAACSKGLLVAERVRRRIEQKEFVVDGGIKVRLTASIGVAAYPEHAREREALVKLADETMYNSKRGGKNRVTIVDQLQTSISARPILVGS
jgi:diguanylate cyclase (GGDEF)-like protein